MRAKSLRAALGLVVVAGAMTLFNLPRANALDVAQFMCGVNAEKAYNDSKGGDRAASYNIYQNALARCRHVREGVGSAPRAGF
jgi:hypothetical protein